MGRWRFVFVLFLLLLITQSAFAQNDSEIERLHIDIWPEYDQPEVLVIYRITLSPVMSLPAEFSIRIPKTVGKPYNVAMKDIDGLYYPLNYTTINEGQWLRITFFTPSSDLQIEFYDPFNSCGEDQRCYNFNWPGDYSIESLTITVQQPLNSKDMQILPDMGTGQLRQDELRYFTTLVGALDKNEPYSVQISYEKSDDTLSASVQPVEPIAPINQETAGRTSFQEILLWIVGVFGLVMIIGVGFWVWSSGWKMKQAMPPAQPGINETVIEQGHDEYVMYCNQCGKRASKGDVYCRTCGEKLLPDRRSE